MSYTRVCRGILCRLMFAIVWCVSAASFGAISVVGPANPRTLVYSDPADLGTTIDPAGGNQVQQDVFGTSLSKSAFLALNPQVIAFNGAPASFTYLLNQVVVNYSATGTVTFTFPPAGQGYNADDGYGGYNYGGAASQGRGAFSGNANDCISTLPTKADDPTKANWFDARISTTGGQGVKAIGFCAAFRNTQNVPAGTAVFTLSDGTNQTIDLPALGALTGAPYEYIFVGYQAPAGKTIARVEASRTSTPGGGYVAIDDLSFVMEAAPPALIGDINNDGYVNVGDLQLLVAAWGAQKTPPSSNWNADADLNSDGFVNVGDLQLLVAHWGQSRADTTAPAAVTNLAAGNPTVSSLTLTWTAPGDDGNTGTAASYDIRYSTTSISEANWASATPVTGEPAPLAAGTSQSMVVSGLSAGTTYYFAMKAADEVPNTSPLSNVASASTTDTVAPAAVTNLATSNATGGSITLTWTAPGDDGVTGTATSYDIRYSTSSITEANWASATQVTGEPVPLAAGTSQSKVVAGLSASTTYYFALKTADEVPNWSALSNSPSGTTTASGGSFVDVHATNLSFDGCFGLPPWSEAGLWDGQPNLGFSDGTITGLRVNGQVHLFLLGNEVHGAHLYEIQPPAVLAQKLDWDGVNQGARDYDPPGAYGGQNRHGVRASFIHRWGDVAWDGTASRRDNRLGNQTYMYGLQFLPGTTTLIQTYADGYNVGGGDPAFFMSALDFQTQTYTPYGPWRFNMESKMLNGYIVTFPQDIADAHLNGRRLAMGGTATSGIAGCPIGCYLRPIESPTPSTPPNHSWDSTWSLTVNPPLLGFNSGTPQPIPASWGVNRKMCGWKDLGDVHGTLTADIPAGATEIPVSDTSIFCRTNIAGPNGRNGSEVGLGVFGGYLGPTWATGGFTYTGRTTTSGPGSLTGVSGVLASYPRTAGTIVQLGFYDDLRGATIADVLPTFGPISVNEPGNAGSFMDYVNAAVVIRRNDNNHAAVMFGCQLATTKPGGNYPPDGCCHVGYTIGGLCPHGQWDALHQATGPRATSRRPALIFYSMNDILAVADGTLAWQDIQPSDFIYADTLCNQLPGDATRNNGTITGMWFDDVDNKLYISVDNLDSNADFYSQCAVIYRFSVN